MVLQKEKKVPSESFTQTPVFESASKDAVAIPFAGHRDITYKLYTEIDAILQGWKPNQSSANFYFILRLFVDKHIPNYFNPHLS